MRSRIGSDKERLAHSKCSKVFTLTHYITASSALMIKSIITSWALPTSFPVPTDVTTALKEKCICCFLLMEPVDGTYSAITWSNEHCPFTEGAATSPLTFFISFSASSKVDSVSQIKKLTQYIKLQRVPSHFCLRCCTHSPQEQPLFPPAASQARQPMWAGAQCLLSHAHAAHSMDHPALCCDPSWKFSQKPGRTTADQTPPPDTRLECSSGLRWVHLGQLTCNLHGLVIRKTPDVETYVYKGHVCAQRNILWKIKNEMGSTGMCWASAKEPSEFTLAITMELLPSTSSHVRLHATDFFESSLLGDCLSLGVPRELPHGLGFLGSWQTGAQSWR